MNLFSTKPDGSREVIDEVINIGEIDYVKDGVIHRSRPLKAVMVKQQSVLAKLDSYEPGTIAFTVGFSNVWQKDIDGTWVSIV